MSKGRIVITIILSVISVILISVNHYDGQTNQSVDNYLNAMPSYQSQHMVTLAYEPNGKLGYKLIADEVQYFAVPENTWFTQPKMTVYDEKMTAIWTISADKAELTKNNLLYLKNNVIANSLIPDFQIQKITTNEAQIDLITQNITSEYQVDIYGPQVHSKGMKFRGNLRKKTATLIDDVQTIYTSNTNSSSGN